MRGQFTYLIALILTLLFNAPANATPSNQIWIPSTDTQPVGTVHLGIDNHTTLFKKREDGGRDLPTAFGLSTGIVDSPYIGLEFGFDLKEASDEPTFFNVKVQIKEDSVATYFPSVAMGAYDVGTSSDETDFNIFYLLVGKTVPVAGRFTVGYYIGNENLLVTENYGLLASWDRTLAEIDDRLWVAIDYMGGENLYGATSLGFSWRFSPNIGALVGYNIFSNKDISGENTFTVQIDIDF